MILERGMICSRLHLRHFNSMPCATIFASRLPQRHRCSCGSSLGSLNSTKTSFCILLFPLTRLASAVDPLRKHGKTRQESPHSKLSCDEENKMSDRKEEAQDERRFIAYEKSWASEDVKFLPTSKAVRKTHRKPIGARGSMRVSLWCCPAQVAIEVVFLTLSMILKSST
jgi:hypothetical protein